MEYFLEPSINSSRCTLIKRSSATVRFHILTRPIEAAEIDIVIGNPFYWNKGLGALVVTRLTTLAFTRYALHRVYAVIQGGNIASRRCFEKSGLPA